MPEAAFDRLLEAIAHVNLGQRNQWTEVAAAMGPALRGFRGEKPLDLARYLRNNVINCIVDWLHAHRFGFEFIEHIR
jgi:hypothetical protein